MATAASAAVATEPFGSPRKTGSLEPVFLRPIATTANPGPHHIRPLSVTITCRGAPISRVWFVPLGSLLGKPLLPRVAT